MPPGDQDFLASYDAYLAKRFPQTPPQQGATSPAPQKSDENWLGQYDEYLKKRFPPPSQPQQTQGIGSRATLEKIANGQMPAQAASGQIDPYSLPVIKPSFGRSAIPQKPVSQMSPKEYEAQYRNAFDAGETQPLGRPTFEQILQTAQVASLAARPGLMAANSALLGIPSALAPQTYNDLTQAASTGNTDLDRALDIGGSIIGGFTGVSAVSSGLNALRIAREGSALNTALSFTIPAVPNEVSNVVQGNESVPQAAGNLALSAGAGVLMHGAGLATNLIPSASARAVTGALTQGVILGSQPVTEAAIEGKPVDWTDVATQAGTGAVFGFVGARGHAQEMPSPQQNFVEEMAPQAARASEATGLPQDFILSQWAHESNFGQSDVAKRTGNLAGLKTAKGAAEGTEQYKGFSSPDEFTDAYIKTINSKRYKEARNIAANGGTAEEIAASLQQHGYAEDPNYAAKIAVRHQEITGIAQNQSEVQNATTTRDIQPNSQPEYQGALEGTPAPANGAEVRGETSAPSGRGNRAGGETKEPNVSEQSESLIQEVQNAIPIQGRQENAIPGGNVEGGTGAQPTGIDERIPDNGQDRQDNTEVGGARAGNLGGNSGGESLRQGTAGENETAAPENNVVPNALDVQSGASALGGATAHQAVEGIDYGARPALREIARGDKTKVISPAGNEYDGHYAVVDLSELTPSQGKRDPKTGEYSALSFEDNPDYPPGVQDRDYKNSQNERAKVIRNGNDLKPSILVNDSPVSDVGPPIVDAKGRVAGGNGRTMSMVRSFSNDAGAHQDYKATLVKKASQFGIDPEDVRGLKNPVLVRVLPDVELKSDQASASLVREMNAPQTMEKDPTAAAISAGRSLTPEQHEAIGGILEKHNSLSEAFQDPATSKKLIRSLEQANIITNENRPRLVEETKKGPGLTDAGKDFVSDMMVSKVLPDVDLAKATPRVVKEKIAKAALPLAQADRFDGWSLEHPVREAIEDINAQRASGLNDEEWKSQMSFDREPLSAEGEAMRNLLTDSRQKPLRNFAEKYAEEARADKGEASEEMFGKPVRDPSETLIRLSEKETGKPITAERRLVAPTPGLSREEFHKRYDVAQGHLPKMEREAWKARVDVWARQWARRTGQYWKEFFPATFADVRSGEGMQKGEPILYQTSKSGLYEALAKEFPSMPEKTKQSILAQFRNQGFTNGKRGGTIRDEAINRAGAEARHKTNYDDLWKNKGLSKDEARKAVQSAVDQQFREWRKPAASTKAQLYAQSDAKWNDYLLARQAYNEARKSGDRDFIQRARDIMQSKREAWKSSQDDANSLTPAFAQVEGDIIKAGVSFTDDGKAILNFTKASDITSAFHELGHIWRRSLDGDDLRIAEKWAGVENGNWTRDNEERFARGFERYLMDGKAPNARLAGLFQNLKQWFTDVYESIKGGPLDVQLSTEIRGVFDKFFTEPEEENPMTKTPSEGLVPPGSLRSAILPGADVLYNDLKKVVTKEILPAVQGGAHAIGEAAGQIQSAVSPSSRGEIARLMKGVMRKNLAQFARKTDALVAGFKNAAKAMDKLPVEARYEYMRQWEHGQKQATPELELIAQAQRDARDDRVKQVQALGTGKLQSLIENYFPHIWKDPAKAEAAFREFNARRPFEGNKSWTKQRVIDYIEEGRAMGLELVTDNPIELMNLRLHQMDKFIMAHRVMNEAKELGISKYKRVFEPLAPGERKINDTVGMVFGNPRQPISPEFEEMLNENPNLVGKKGAFRPGGLTNIRGTLEEQNPQTDVHGLVIRGYYVMPEEAARLLNNYLSPGLQEKSAMFRNYRASANLLNQFQLGWSAFHAGFVTLDAMISRVALSAYQVAHGQPIAAAKSLITAPAAPFQMLREGNRMYKEWTNPGSQGEYYGKLIDALIQGGGRAKMDSFYGGEQWDKMMRAWHDSTGPIEKVIRAGIRLPFAATEKAIAPLQQYLVPRMKMGLFAKMAETDLALLGPDASTQEIGEAMGKAWDSVDNRLGQLTYDNLFWNRATKDIAMASIRSLGWNLGTFRELGGSIVDWGRFAKNVVTRGAKAEFTHRMSYTIALPAVTALVGAITQKILTGQGPQELKDYFYPRNGDTNKDGTPARLALPTYMKDVYSYGNDVKRFVTIGGNPFRTVLNKAHPAIGIIAEMLENRDYYGVEIRNSDDPLIQQVWDDVKFAGKSFEPFSFQGIERNLSQSKTSAKSFLPFVGVTPAPKEISQTEAEQLMSKYAEDNRTVGTRTKAEKERTDNRNNLVDALRTRDAARAHELVASGTLSYADIKLAQREAPVPHDAVLFNKLTLPQKMNVYEIMTPEARSMYAGNDRYGDPTTVRQRLWESWKNDRKQGRIRTEDLPAIESRIRTLLYKLPYRGITVGQ